MSHQKDSFKFLYNLSKQPKAQKDDKEKSSQVAFLGIKIHDRTFYLQVSRVREIIPSPTITPIGHTQEWLHGLIKVQGEIFSVVDIAPLFDMPVISAREQFVVALSIPEGNYAIVASGVLGISKISDLKQIDADDYTITYQSAEKEEIPALSVKSIFESSALANMSIF